MTLAIDSLLGPLNEQGDEVELDPSTEQVVDGAAAVLLGEGLAAPSLRQFQNLVPLGMGLSRSAAAFSTDALASAWTQRPSRRAIIDRALVRRSQIQQAELDESISSQQIEQARGLYRSVFWDPESGLVVVPFEDSTLAVSRPDGSGGFQSETVPGVSLAHYRMRADGTGAVRSHIPDDDAPGALGRPESRMLPGNVNRSASKRWVYLGRCRADTPFDSRVDNLEFPAPLDREQLIAMQPGRLDSPVFDDPVGAVRRVIASEVRATARNYADLLVRFEGQLYALAGPFSDQMYMFRFRPEWTDGGYTLAVADRQAPDEASTDDAEPVPSDDFVRRLSVVKFQQALDASLITVEARLSFSARRAEAVLIVPATQEDVEAGRPPLGVVTRGRTREGWPISLMPHATHLERVVRQVARMDVARAVAYLDSIENGLRWNILDTRRVRQSALIVGLAGVRDARAVEAGHVRQDMQGALRALGNPERDAVEAPHVPWPPDIRSLVTSRRGAEPTVHRYLAYVYGQRVRSEPAQRAIDALEAVPGRGQHLAQLLRLAIMDGVVREHERWLFSRVERAVDTPDSVAGTGAAVSLSTIVQGEPSMNGRRSVGLLECWRAETSVMRAAARESSVHIGVAGRSYEGDPHLVVIGALAEALCSPEADEPAVRRFSKLLADALGSGTLKRAQRVLQRGTRLYSLADLPRALRRYAAACDVAARPGPFALVNRSIRSAATSPEFVAQASEHENVFFYDTRTDSVVIGRIVEWGEKYDRVPIVQLSRFAVERGGRELVAATEAGDPEKFGERPQPLRPYPRDFLTTIANGTLVRVGARPPGHGRRFFLDESIYDAMANGREVLGAIRDVSTFDHTELEPWAVQHGRLMYREPGGGSALLISVSEASSGASRVNARRYDIVHRAAGEVGPGLPAGYYAEVVAGQFGSRQDDDRSTEPIGSRGLLGFRAQPGTGLLGMPDQAPYRPLSVYLGPTLDVVDEGRIPVLATAKYESAGQRPVLVDPSLVVPPTPLVRRAPAHQPARRALYSRGRPVIVPPGGGGGDGRTDRRGPGDAAPKAPGSGPRQDPAGSGAAKKARPETEQRVIPSASQTVRDSGGDGQSRGSSTAGADWQQLVKAVEDARRAARNGRDPRTAQRPAVAGQNSSQEPSAQPSVTRTSSATGTRVGQAVSQAPQGRVVVVEAGSTQAKPLPAPRHDQLPPPAQPSPSLPAESKGTRALGAPGRALPEPKPAAVPSTGPRGVAKKDVVAEPSVVEKPATAEPPSSAPQITR